MVRVPNTQSRANGSSALDHTRAERKKSKKDYKILLEAVTQEKRKVHSISSYDAKAPSGFGFIPAGHPEITAWCKEQCRQRNLDVYNVSAKPKSKAHVDPDKISHHVHRMGHHFPLSVIELACTKFGYVFEDNVLRRDASRWLQQRMEDYDQRMNLKGGTAAEKESPDHIRGSIREMFPKIPEDDLTTIVTHAFKKGTDRVGNATNLTLARRVQLAVVAHIRHNYTGYDKILKEKTGTWSEARVRVEHDTLAKLVEWRDEANTDCNEMEETFREVIILDDDDDGGSEDTDSTIDERDTSVEIFSSRATARELLPGNPLDVARVPRIRQGPGGSIMLRPARVAPQPSNTHYSPRLSRTHATSLRLVAPAEPKRYLPIEPSRPPPPPMYSSQSAEYQSLPRVPQPMRMRGSDGILYNLEPVEVRRPPPRIVGFARPRDCAREEYAHSPQRVHSFDSSQVSRPAPPSRRTSEQEVVLPSVEREPESLPSPRRNTGAMYSMRTDAMSPKRKAFPISEYSTEHPPKSVPKRFKAAYSQDETRPRFEPSQSSVVRQGHECKPIEHQNLSRAEPHSETIDLTSSPIRPPYGGGREVSAFSRPYAAAEPNSYSYQPAGRQVLMRNVPEEYYGAHVREPTRAPVERRLLPSRDFVPLREEPVRMPVTEGKYLRSGVHHGDYRLH